MRLKFYLMGLGIGVIVAAVIMGIAMRGRTREMTDEEIMARARQLGMVEAGTLAEMTSGENSQNADQNREELTPAPAQEEARAEAGAVAADTGASANAGGAATILEAAAENSAQDAQTSGEGDEEGTGSANEDQNMVVEGEPDDGEDMEEAEEDDADDEADDAAAAVTVADTSASADTEDRTQAAADSAGSDASVERTGTNGSTAAGNAAQESASSDSAQASGSIVVTIPDGLYSEDIASLLENAGVVDNAAAFNDYLVNSGMDRYITVGARLIPRGSSYEDVARIITGR